MKELTFALCAIKKNIENSAELRTSFVANVIGMMINNVAFVILWGSFVLSVGIIHGWTVTDVIGLQGFMACSFGMAFSAANGLRKIPEYVTNGVFDQCLLSPKHLLIRAATMSFGTSAIGDLFFGVTCLFLYGILSHLTLPQVLLGFFFVLISALMFLAAIIVVISTSFFFMDATIVTTGLFELFLTPSLFHGGIFQGTTRFIFTFLIPSLVVAALPVEIIKHPSLEKIILVTCVAIAWFLLSLKIFYAGVKRYESSNLMTFGGG